MIDLSPRPGAAPLTRQVLAQARMEVRLLLRNGEQLLLALIIPGIVLVGGVLGAQHLVNLDGEPIDVLSPGVFALAIMSTAFTSVAITTGFERRYGVLKRLGASPLPRGGLLVGKIGALLVVEVMQIAVIGVVAYLMGWRPTFATGAVLAAIAGTFAFASLGLLMAGLLRAEATLAAANLVYLLLLAAGAVVLPASVYGGWGDVAAWLPSGALGESMRAALIDGVTDWPAIAVLSGWGGVGTWLTARTFRWE